MISFAQNREDVVLERIFRDKLTGFYVDVGACHPVYESVTYHFYLRGWSGVNIEPQPDLFTELLHERPRDVNLNVCVGRGSGRRKLYVTSDRGTSTLDESLGRRYRLEGRLTGAIEVEVASLNDIWRVHVGAREVDFLKIDVEGFEAEVLSNVDFDLVAPLVLVVEAIHPTSRVQTNHLWEEPVLARYTLFYFDGLNRFYHRSDIPLDHGRHGTPPNVLDRFKSHREHLAEQASRHLEAENASFREQLQNLSTLLAQKDAALQHAAEAYAELESRFKQQLKDLQQAAGKS